MKRPILVVLSFLLLQAAASAAVLKKAEITAVINDVKLLEANAAARGAKVTDVVQGETAVKTGIESRSELLFQDKTLTRLGANSLFSFTQGTRDLELEHGTMLLQCPKGVGGARIRTAAVTAAIAGTTIMIEYAPAALPKRKPGYIPTIAEMTPEEAVAELQHPRRNYTKPEHRELEAKARLARKGGAGGYVKVLVLEGTLRLYLNNQVGESVLITAGHMVIMNPNADTIPPTVVFDIAKLMKTSLLVGGWGSGATDLSQARIAQEENLQDQLKAQGYLLDTNLLIPGGGTEVFTLAQLSQIIQAQSIAIATPPPDSPITTGGGGTTTTTGGGGTTTTTTTTTGGNTNNGQLATITNPDPFVFGPNTTFNTDPSVTVNGVTGLGSTYVNSTLNGPLATFYFGSTNSFESGLLGDAETNFMDLDFGYYAPPAGGFATFKFADLQIVGQPTINTAGGATYMSLISVGTMTSALPGGTINLDMLDGLFLATVNNSVTLGPELNFTSTRTFTPISITPENLGLYLEVYARGASSDLLFGSDVNFIDRDLRLDAGQNVEISGNISVLPSGPRTNQFPDVSIAAGNNFILDASGQLHTDVLSITAADVVGLGGATVSATEADLHLQNAQTLTQTGPNILVNTLPFNSTSLVTLQVSSKANVNISSNLTAANPNSVLSIDSGGILSINGNLSFREVDLSAQNLNGGGSIQAMFFSEKTATSVTLSQPGLQVLGGVLVPTGSHFSVSTPGSALTVNWSQLGLLSLTAPSIQVTGNLFPAGSLELGGNSITVGNPITPVTIMVNNGSVQIESFDGIGPVNATIYGNVNDGAFLEFGAAPTNLTVTGTVTVGAIGANASTTQQVTSVTLSAASVNAGELQLQGQSGDVSSPTGGSGSNLTLTATANSVGFGIASFDGGDAAAGSGMAGGNGGSLTVNSTSDLTINSNISATTGGNDTGVASGGNGGTVNLNATNGAVTVSSAIQVSSDGLTAPTNRVSKQGGNINLQTGKTSGPGITVTSTGQLLALLNATAPGPGGTVQLISAGADIRVGGTIQADRGTINMQNNGASGQVAIISGAQLSADVIRAGALGANGQLTISAGSQINANSLLKLYGGTGASGMVLFTGTGNVNISGNMIHIAATTVQIDPTTHVNNTGSTFVHTTNPNYGVGAGGGNFQNPVTRTSLSSAPTFNP